MASSTRSAFVSGVDSSLADFSNIVPADVRGELKELADSVPFFEDGEVGATRVTSDPQAAINNASPGDTIIGDGSTFTLSSGLEITTSHLTVANLNLQLADGVDEPVVYIHSCQDVTLRNCDIDGNEANQTGDVNIVNGVDVTNARRIRLIGNEVHDTQGQGIYITTNHQDSNKTSGDVQDVVVAYNRVQNVGNGAILLMGGDNNTSRNGWLIGNHIQAPVGNEAINIIDGWVQGYAIGNRLDEDLGTAAFAIENHNRTGVKSTQGVWIVNNYVDNNDQLIVFDHDDFPYTDVYIKNNYLRSSADRILIGYKEGVQTSTNGDFDGIEITGNTVVGGGVGTGVSLQGNSQPNTRTFRNIKIQDNRLESLNSAVRKADGSANPIRVVNNTIRDCSNGIEISDSPQCIVSGNYFEDIGSVAIKVREDQSAVNTVKNIYGCHIQNNVVRQPTVTGDEGAFQIGQERHADTFDYAVVTGNTTHFDNSGTSPIDLQSTQNNTVTANNVTVPR